MKFAITLMMILMAPATLFADAIETEFLQDGTEYFADRFLITISNGVQPLDTETIVSGTAFTGVTSIDNLCARYNVVDVEPFYSGPVHTPALKNIVPRIYIFHINRELSVLNAVEAFKDISEVEFSDIYDIPQTDYIPNDPQRNAQYFFNNIDAYEAWDIIHGDTTRIAIVSIVDTGVYWTHPDLAANMWINEAEDLNSNGTMDAGDYNGVDDDGNGYVDDVIGWDSGMNDNDPAEEFPEHGTHVAGCASEVTDNGIGGAGVGFAARIMANKGANSGGSLTAVYQAMVWATQNGTHVINCSWGSSYYSGTNQNLVNGMWDDGVVIVASAGNHGTSQQHYPGAYNNVVGVVSTNQTDHKSGFSAYGTWCDISSPGSNIYSTWATGTYAYLDGTSMASPIAAGCFALLKAANPSYTNADLVDVILSSADDIDDINPGYEGQLGSGRINIYSALASSTMPNIQEAGQQITITDDDGDGVLNPGESFELVLTLENIWAEASNVNVTLTGNEYFDMSDSVASLGNLAHNEQGDNAASPFVITAIDEMPPTESVINMNITADGYETDIDLLLTTSLYQANFPFDIPGNIESSPLMIDVYGDSNKEIIVGASDNNVYVIGADGQNIPGWPQAVSHNVITGPAVGSLAANSTLQIVATTKDGMVNAWNVDGSQVSGFPYDMGGTIYSGAMLLDIDGNNDLEIVAGSFSDNKIYVLNHNGSDFPGWPLTMGNRLYGSPASGDIDNDDLPEIVYAGFDSLLHVLNADGSEVTGFPVALDDVVWSSAAVGDIDDDNMLEIAVVSGSGSLYLLNHDGTIVSGFPVSSSGLVRCAPSLGDIDGNGTLDISFGGSDGVLHAFNSAGAELTGFPVSLGGNLTATPVIGDITGDGSADLVLGNSDAELFGIDNSGNMLAYFPIVAHESGQISGTAALNDLDNDGDMEIAVGIRGTGMNMIVVDYKNTASTDDLIWPMFGKDVWRSNNISTVVTSNDDELTVPSVFSLEQNYPNPFNAQTTIRFSLEAPGQATPSMSSGPFTHILFSRSG